MHCTDCKIQGFSVSSSVRGKKCSLLSYNRMTDERRSGHTNVGLQSDGLPPAIT